MVVCEPATISRSSVPGRLVLWIAQCEIVTPSPCSRAFAMSLRSLGSKQTMRAHFFPSVIRPSKNLTDAFERLVFTGESSPTTTPWIVAEVDGTRSETSISVSDGLLRFAIMVQGTNCG